MTPPDAPADAPGGGATAARPAAARTDRQALWDDVGVGWTMSVEFLTATLVWGGIGWLVDLWLGTGPWLMSVGFVLGNALGFYLVWLRSSDPPEASPPGSGGSRARP
ncbi:MAG: AtpZ/AtpI family protein [Actinomycetota bacterium]|nr:AtpZ/AtpI family protein [Actinomycetota bacterium]